MFVEQNEDVGVVGEEGPAVGRCAAVVAGSRFGGASGAELRPEWGLAGNWAIVIGPRTLSAAADLDGCVFLHEYDAARDADGAALEGIMTAPLVVSHWINMQYYASTIDNQRYGAGNKAIHSVVGGFGLMAGGGGDLLTGLPLQSLADGGGWRHEPLRLQAVIAAGRDRIAAIVRKHALLEQLVSHDWLAIIAVDEGRFFRLTGRLAWQPLHVPDQALQTVERV